MQKAQEALNQQSQESQSNAALPVSFVLESYTGLPYPDRRSERTVVSGVARETEGS